MAKETEYPVSAQAEEPFGIDALRDSDARPTPLMKECTDGRAMIAEIMDDGTYNMYLKRSLLVWDKTEVTRTPREVTLTSLEGEVTIDADGFVCEKRLDALASYLAKTALEDLKRKTDANDTYDSRNSDINLVLKDLEKKGLLKISHDIDENLLPPAFYESSQGQALIRRKTWIEDVLLPLTKVKLAEALQIQPFKVCLTGTGRSRDQIVRRDSCNTLLNGTPFNYLEFDSKLMYAKCGDTCFKDGKINRADLQEGQMLEWYLVNPMPKDTTANKYGQVTREINNSVYIVCDDPSKFDDRVEKYITVGLQNDEYRYHGGGDYQLHIQHGNLNGVNLIAKE